MHIAPRFAIFCALLVSSGPVLAVKTAPASEVSVVLHSTIGRVIAAPQSIPAVKPGETFGISGDCIMPGGAAADVRVVFSLANDEEGYKAILATHQKQDGGMLRVRAPYLPDMADRTVRIELYLMGHDDPPQVCNAGAIHIG